MPNDLPPICPIVSILIGLFSLNHFLDILLEAKGIHEYLINSSFLVSINEE
jgi:hypothetical protein